MKIPQPMQLPSGKWRVQVLVDKKRLGRSFDTEQEAIYWVTGIKTKMAERQEAPRKMTIGKAVDTYIESKDAVLSPSTIAGYKRIRTNLMTGISSVQVGDLTQENVQRWVNALSKSGRTPKTIRNAHGLLSAILAECRPSMALHTTLPQKVKYEVQIPSEEEAKAIIAASKGTKYELSILLAMWLGLRESEILGLTADCIDGDKLTIKHAIVMGESGPVEKGTKTYSSTRKIRIPSTIEALIDTNAPNGSHLVPLSAHAIYNGFRRICEKAGVPKFRFHDLRHFNASVMLASGIPDKYSMRRMGHATNNMLKTTYQHTIKEKEKEYDDLIDACFESILGSGK